MVLRYHHFGVWYNCVIMDMYYDKCRHFPKHNRQQILALLCWLWAHCPKHRLFEPKHIGWAVFVRGIEGIRSASRTNQFRQGNAWTPNMYRGILDHYVGLGWPPYCMIVSHDNEKYIFKQEHLAGVLEVLNDYQVGQHTPVRSTSSRD